MPETAFAKVFMTGRSQTVRLPKGFRFNTDRVRSRADGSRVILEPVERDWVWLCNLHDLGPLDDDAVWAAEEGLLPQDRPELDVFR